MLSIQEQMRNSVELFHYSRKFNNQIFVLYLQNVSDLKEISDDLKVIHSSHIRSVIVCPHNSDIERLFQTWISLGRSYEYLKIPPHRNALAEKEDRIAGLLGACKDPVLAVEDQNGAVADHEIQEFSLEAGRLFGATKIFFPGQYRGLEVNGELQSHPSHSELDTFLSNAESINIGRKKLKFFRERQRDLDLEIVLLEAKGGVLFQEIFTHGGKGTLLSSDFPNVFRKASALDVPDIMFMMKPYIEEGKILFIQEEQVLDQIDMFYVYSVDKQIVASAKLKDYGDCYELGKICTLPRYQRKGRARTLVLKMIEISRNKGKRYVFSLSVEPMMWRFYLNLGFKNIPREELPLSWKETYDFSRPSRAFSLEC